MRPDRHGRRVKIGGLPACGFDGFVRLSDQMLLPACFVTEATGSMSIDVVLRKDWAW